MTYKLKNQVLWDALLNNQANFQTYFDNQCEAAEASGGVIVARLVFTPDQIEKVKEYNPHDWNDFPEVTPPENTVLRCEFLDDGKPVCFAGFYCFGEWRLALNKLKVGTPRRYRAWMD